MTKRALVTGASRGIGASIAHRLAQAGHEVIVNYRSRHKEAEAVAQAIADEGGKVSLLPFDVSDPTSSRQALEQVLADGPIQILVNNAGIARDTPMPSMSFEDWQSVTRTTLDGFFNVTQPLLMPMVRTRWGRIVNISSVSGVLGNRGQVNYSAAKAGLIGATKALAQEMAKRKITVNAVAPGLINTEMIAEAPLEQITKQIPMRRIGNADEVASSVAFLVSEEASYITGQVLGINGGLG